ncbi:MAG: hypothetical protein ABIF77_00945 [bacterium]
MKGRLSLSFGTFATSLAKAQTQEVINRIQTHYPRLTCQMHVISSPISGEETSDEPFLACTAAEVEFLEEHLLAGEFRCIVQRAADLVLPLREGVIFAAVPARNTPFDALLNRQGQIADELPEDAKVGVLNLRTKSQLLTLYPHMEIEIITGGVEAALELLLRRCQLDSLVLPAAITEHLGIQGIVTEIFFPEIMLPSCGQGILAILAREEDKETIEILKAIHDQATFLEMEAENAFMQRFASDQDLPISALAQVNRRQIRVEGSICPLRGGVLNRSSQEGLARNAVQIGTDLAEKLLMSGDSVIDLLEADFPDGLPDSDLDDVLDKDLPDELEAVLESELDGDLDLDLDLELDPEDLEIDLDDLPALDADADDPPPTG